MRVASVIVMLALTLAACGGSGGKASKGQRQKAARSTSTATAAPSASPAPAPAPASAKPLRRREAAALARTKAHPRAPGAYEDLLRARYALARAPGNLEAGTYTKAGKAVLRKATRTWNAYLALHPHLGDGQLDIARQTAGAYTTLGNLHNALLAAQSVAAIQHTSTTYQQLAQLAYGSGETAIGRRAAARAIALAPAGQRADVRAQMRQFAATS